MLNDYKVGDTVNDDAGNAGEVVELLDEYYVLIEWEDGSQTKEQKKHLIWVG